jgi:hypothetical protein
MGRIVAQQGSQQFCPAGHEQQVLDQVPEVSPVGAGSVLGAKVDAPLIKEHFLKDLETSLLTVLVVDGLILWFFAHG